MQAGLQGPSGAILFGASMITLLTLVNAKSIGVHLGVMDHPDTGRKRHAQVTPLVGGLAIMMALTVWAGTSLFLGLAADRNLLLTVLLCGAGATLVGYADDQSSTSPSSRILSLFLLSAIAMVIDPGLLPTQLSWGSFEPTSLPGWFAFIFVTVAMAGYVNAVNMADGQNGVVTGMYVIWATCLLLVTGGSSAATAQVLLETVFITFLFNMAGRVFLGDAGTYGVTFVFGILAIQAHNRWGVSAETITVWFFIPVMDCIRLMVSRALQGHVPSSADRNHFHHRLQDRVGGTFGLAIYLGVVGTSSLAASLFPHLALLCMVLLAAFYFSFAWLTAVDIEEDQEIPSADDGKVVKFDSKDKTAAKH
jgi:UDP-GlcNAc:undecaprenyl-phosphate GlcNAc-1-phosphate transferase